MYISSCLSEKKIINFHRYKYIWHIKDMYQHTKNRNLILILQASFSHILLSRMEEAVIFLSPINFCKNIFCIFIYLKVEYIIYKWNSTSIFPLNFINNLEGFSLSSYKCLVKEITTILWTEGSNNIPKQSRPL
jgi:hypothetical protein